LLDGNATSTAHALYLLLAGGTMTGDLNMGSNDVLNADTVQFDTDVQFKDTANHVALMNKAGDTYRNLSVSTIRAEGYQPMVSTSYFDTRNVAAATSIIFRARDLDTSTLTECAKLLSNSEPELGISRAGHIDMAKANTYDIGATRAPRHIYTDGDMIVGQYLEVTADIYYTSPTGLFDTDTGVASYIRMRSHTGAAYQTAIELVGGYADIPRAGDITMLAQKMMTFGTYTDAQRPAAGTAGRWIFNTDDGMPNYDDGTDWRDINGNIT